MAGKDVNAVLHVTVEHLRDQIVIRVVQQSQRYDPFTGLPRNE